MKGTTFIKMFVAASTFFILSASQAANIASPTPFALNSLPQWGPQATIGGALGFTHNDIDTSDDINKFVYGNFLLPIAQNNDSLFYLDGREVISSGNGLGVTNSTNLGGGYRQIINNSYILGGYAFADYEHSLYDNDFYQGHVGAEYISTTWQARINGYLPVGDKNETTNTHPPVDAGDQSIIYPGTVGLVEYPFLEHAEAGGDIQIGSALPFLPSLFPFVGYYHFGFDQNQDTSINGGRAGLEYTYNRWLTLYASDQFDNLSKNLAIIGVDVNLGGPHYPNCASPIDYLMEETPFGINGLF